MICDNQNTHTHNRPKRSILTTEDLARFATSQTHSDIVLFLEQLSNAVRGKTLSQQVLVSHKVALLIEKLNLIQNWLTHYPAVQNGDSRFGNAVFRDWWDKLAAQSESLLEDIVPAHEVAECATYLANSFGDRLRIDYGSGHELHFIIFLFTLAKLNVIDESDYPALVLRVFWKYIMVMRAVQSTYWLEPAGSHGVWGLDDYHFLPFYFGASQLADHKHLRPKSIHDKEILDEFHKDYMYFDSIHFINGVIQNVIPGQIGVIAVAFTHA